MYIQIHINMGTFLHIFTWIYLYGYISRAKYSIYRLFRTDWLGVQLNAFWHVFVKLKFDRDARADRTYIEKKYLRVSTNICSNFLKRHRFLLETFWYGFQKSQTYIYWWKNARKNNFSFNFSVIEQFWWDLSGKLANFSAGEGAFERHKNE